MSSRLAVIPVYYVRYSRDYVDPAKAEEARKAGNEMFQSSKYPEAIRLYDESIKRAPADPRGYSNRAAAYTKLGSPIEALKDCEKALELDPNFNKAYLRKAQCHYMMKDFHKALDTYDKALKLFPEVCVDYLVLLAVLCSYYCTACHHWLHRILI